MERKFGNFLVVDILRLMYGRKSDQKKEKVDWQRLLLAPFNIPKHSIIAWMAIFNRLPTEDRLKSWGIEMEGICVFCQQEMETTDHLFFGCIYSQGIWKEVLQLCGLDNDVTGWAEELKWAKQRLKGKALISILLRIGWNALEY